MEAGNNECKYKNKKNREKLQNYRISDAKGNEIEKVQV